MDFFYYPFLISTGSLNMSIDKNLLEYSKIRNCVNLRFYLWSSPTISFGKNQKPEEVVNFNECKKYKIDLVKRPTGGRALLHFKELTYAISGPLDGKTFPKNFQENYKKISKGILKAFEFLKIPVEIKKQNSPYSTSPLNPLPCFVEPAPGEIVVNNKKIVGSAMLIEEEFFLIHGSIIIDFDEKIQKKCFKAGEKFLASKLIDFLNPLPVWYLFLQYFKRGFEKTLGKNFTKRNFSKKFLKKAIFESSNYKILKD